MHFSTHINAVQKPAMYWMNPDECDFLNDDWCLLDRHPGADAAERFRHLSRLPETGINRRPRARS